jgi:hypothetical protein
MMPYNGQTRSAISQKRKGSRVEALFYNPQVDTVVGQSHANAKTIKRLMKVAIPTPN